VSYDELNREAGPLQKLWNIWTNGVMDSQSNWKLKGLFAAFHRTCFGAYPPIFEHYPPAPLCSEIAVSQGTGAAAKDLYRDHVSVGFKTKSAMTLSEPVNPNFPAPMVGDFTPQTRTTDVWSLETPAQGASPACQ